jgi:hypothetical protein
MQTSPSAIFAPILGVQTIAIPALDFSSSIVQYASIALLGWPIKSVFAATTTTTEQLAKAVIQQIPHGV